MGRANIIRKGDCGQRTRELVARYYLTLLGEFKSNSSHLYLSMSSEDMFHNAITMILQDSKFQRLTTDVEIMALIRKRIRNVISEIKQDHNQQTMKAYADDLQTKEEE